MIQFSDNNSKDSNICNILVVGNGYDLALGLKTKFKDFFLFLSLSYFYNFFLEISLNIKSSFEPRENQCQVERELQKCADNKCYKDLIKECKNYVNYIDYIDIAFSEPKIKRIEFFKKIDAFMNNPFGSLLFNNIASGYFKKNAVETPDLKLEYVPSCYIDLNLNVVRVDDFSNFHQSFITYLSHLFIQFDKFKEIYKWCDVETLIKDFTCLDKSHFIQKYSLNSDINYTLFDRPYESKLYEQGIYQFLDLFKYYLSNIVNYDNATRFEDKTDDEKINFFKSKIDLSSYSKSLKSRFDSRKFFHAEGVGSNIAGIDLLENVNYVINYNYTTFAELILNAYYMESKPLSPHDIISILNLDRPKFYHPNGCIDNYVNNLVLGFSYKDKDSKYNPNFSFFEKKYQRVIKNVPFIDLNQLTATPYNLLIFGHSCSDADGDILSTLFSSDNLNYAVVCCFDTNSLIQCFKNLYTQLDKSVLDRLLSSKIINVNNHCLKSNTETVDEKFIPANKLIFAVNNDKYYGNLLDSEEK